VRGEVEGRRLVLPAVDEGMTFEISKREIDELDPIQAEIAKVQSEGSVA
jgi:hypothetical protein